MMKRINVVGEKRLATPSLTKVHEIERMVFAAEQLEHIDEYTGHIFLHIDEKNFKAFEFGKGNVYITEKMSAEKVKQLTTLKC